MKKDRLSRILFGDFHSSVIRFKYYGEFDTMIHIREDCKDDINYIGNSNLDGAPVFVYYCNDIDVDVIRDFNSLNKKIRSIKLKYYSKKELSKREKSLLSFFKFFMSAYDNYEIKGVGQMEINRHIEYNAD